MASPLAGKTFRTSSVSPVVNIKVHDGAYRIANEQAKLAGTSTARHMVNMLAEYLGCEVKPEDISRSRARKAIKCDERGYYQVALRLPIEVHDILRRLAETSHSPLTTFIIKVLAKKHGIDRDLFTLPKESRKPMGRPQQCCPHCGLFVTKYITKKMWDEQQAAKAA